MSDDTEQTFAYEYSNYGYYIEYINKHINYNAKTDGFSKCYMILPYKVETELK